MGRLGLLSMELLQNIMGELDFKSLGAMRCLNIQSKAIVEGTPAYRDITAFAHEARRSLSCTRSLVKYSANHLYSVLCEDRCSRCGRFGSFLFLPTGVRCCFSCVERRRPLTDPEMRIMSGPMTEDLYGLTEKALRQISTYTVPGTYTNQQILVHKQHQIVSRVQASALGISIHGSKAAMEKNVALGIRHSSASSRRIRSRVIRTPRMFSGYYLDYSCPFMVVVPFPHLMQEQRRIDRGVSCRGCECDWASKLAGAPMDPNDQWQDLWAERDAIFSENEFLAHFENCELARMLWNDYILGGRDMNECLTSRPWEASGPLDRKLDILRFRI